MPFGSLWLPVLVAAVAVWLLSAVLHMVLKYHRADYRKLPDEEGVGAALGKGTPSPGVYVLPHCEPSSMNDPAVRERYERGPVAMMVVMRNGLPNLPKSLGLWFLFCLLVAFVAAYLARHTLTPGTPGLTVMRLTGAVAFVGYGFGAFQDSIWKSIPWSNSARALIDATLYALVTGIVFAWLWPGA